MSEVNEIIKETAKQTADMNRQEMLLALKDHQLQSEARTREIMKQVMEEEIKKFFGPLEPHDHTNQHQRLMEILELKRGVTKTLWEKFSLWLIAVVAVFFVFVSLGGLSALQINTPNQPRADYQQSSEPKK